MLLQMPETPTVGSRRHQSLGGEQRRVALARSLLRA